MKPEVWAYWENEPKSALATLMDGDISRQFAREMEIFRERVNDKIKDYFQNWSKILDYRLSQIPKFIALKWHIDSLEDTIKYAYNSFATINNYTKEEFLNRTIAWANSTGSYNTQKIYETLFLNFAGCFSLPTKMQGIYMIGKHWKLEYWIF